MAVIYSQDFNSSSNFPTGWEREGQGNWTLYGSEASDTMTSTARGWMIKTGKSSSVGTGAGGGMTSGIGAANGAWSTASKYILYEASSPANNGTRGSMRTKAFDFTNYTNVEATFWFHRYSNDDLMGDFGIAATTSATSSSSAVEAGTGLGFTSNTAGGCPITYWTDNTGSTTATGVRMTGTASTQSSGNSDTLAADNYYRKATVDLSNADGESSVYLHFFIVTVLASTSWKSDMCIDNFVITGDVGGGGIPLAAANDSILFGTNF